MPADYFESSTISTVLSWICAIPMFFGLIFLTIEKLFDQEDFPRAYVVWFLICVLLFSPFRYFIFQLILASSYMVQSWSAFFSAFLLLLYVPLVFGVLYAVSFSLPLLANFWITGLMRNEKWTRFRLFLSAIMTPFFCGIGSYIFLLALPYVGYTTHWLKAENVIRASNGPAWVYFKYIGSHLIPLQTPGYTDEVGNDLKTLYRNHIASVYLSDEQHMRFIKYEYPDFYNSLLDKEKMYDTKN